MDRYEYVGVTPRLQAYRDVTKNLREIWSCNIIEPLAPARPAEINASNGNADTTTSGISDNGEPSRPDGGNSKRTAARDNNFSSTSRVGPTLNSLNSNASGSISGKPGQNNGGKLIPRGSSRTNSLGLARSESQRNLGPGSSTGESSSNNAGHQVTTGQSRTN